MPAERFTPSEGATPSAVVQTKTTPSILPLVISSSDPFADISQAAKGSTSLVVTPSIPGSATRGPDLDLSSEGSANIFEDLDDVPVLKRTISDSDEEGSASSGPDLMGMYLLSSSSFLIFFLYLRFVCILNSPLAETSKGPEIAAGEGMTAPASPVAPTPAAPSVPVSVVPTAPVPSVPVIPLPATPVAPIPGNFFFFALFPFLFYFIPFFFFFFFLFLYSLVFHSPFIAGPLPTIPSQFEAGSSSYEIGRAHV